MALILVRHSTPVIDPEIPSAQWSLSPEGRVAAKSLALKLSNFRITQLVSSDEPKARQTAEPIAHEAGIAVNLDTRLREHVRHSLSFLTRSDFDAGIAQLFARPDSLVFGDETANDVFRRFEAAIADAVSKGDGGDIVLVTHGTAMSIYLSRRSPIEPLDFWRAMTMPMAVLVDGSAVTLI